MGLERVLFIATELEARGTNEYVSYLGAELQRRGMKTTVFCAPGPMLSVLERKNIHVETFPNLTSFRLPSKERAAFRKKLAQFSPDIVHAPSLNAARTYLKLSEEFDVPVVLTMHRAPEKTRRFRTAASSLSGIIVSSHKVREELVNDFRFPKNKIAVINNSIDVYDTQFRTAGMLFDRRVPVLGSVGPVEQARGHETFVEAAALLIQAGRNAQFVVAGEGSEIPKLARLGSQLGLDSCLTFVRDFASYHEVLAALDVVVQSSKVDVSGFSILDAMACGRPVVAFNTGTVCEIIKDGKTGFIVQQAEPRPLAAALAKLIENPRLAQDIGIAAKLSVNNSFNIKKNADYVIQFYNKSLSENVSPKR